MNTDTPRVDFYKDCGSIASCYNQLQIYPGSLAIRPLRVHAIVAERAGVFFLTATMDTRVCQHCKLLKSKSEFGIDSKRKDGFQVWCKHRKSTWSKQNRSKLMEKQRIAQPIWRAKNRRKTVEYAHAQDLKWPEKRKARMACQHAVRTGKIVRGCCVVCGNPKTQGHHEDYSKPLDVVWLCVKHHAEVHHQSKQ